MPDFSSISLWVAAAIFGVAAAVVWAAGTRVSRYADEIAERTGLGRAFVGLLLLGGITSLPEVATSSTAAHAGNAAMAVNNLLGSMTMNVAILAIADAAIGRDALTSVVVRPTVLLLGMLDIVLLSIVSLAVVVGDITVLGLGAWPISITLLYLLGLWMSASYPNRKTWVVADERRGEPPQKEREDCGAQDESGGGQNGNAEKVPPLQSLVIKTCIAGALILVAGFVLTQTAEVIADRTGLGTSFVGAVFLAFSTSLPEVSTVLAAVSLRRYELAVSNILGTNLFNAAMILLVDVFYSGPPALNEVGRFSAVAALLGIVVTAFYMVGLIERRDRTLLRMGYDSWAVLIVYLGGLVLLYNLR